MAARRKDIAPAAGPGVFDEVAAMPGHLLRRCQQIAVSLFLQECRAHDLTPLQFAVLAALADGAPRDQAALAGVVALDRTTVSVVLRRLEARRLVTRRVSDIDRRSKLIHLTAKGRARLAAALPAARAAQHRMLAPLSPAERRAMTTLLRKMADGNNRHSRAPLRQA